MKTFTESLSLLYLVCFFSACQVCLAALGLSMEEATAVVSVGAFLAPLYSARVQRLYKKILG